MPRQQLLMIPSLTGRRNRRHRGRRFHDVDVIPRNQVASDYQNAFAGSRTSLPSEAGTLGLSLGRDSLIDAMQTEHNLDIEGNEESIMMHDEDTNDYNEGRRNELGNIPRVSWQERIGANNRRFFFPMNFQRQLCYARTREDLLNDEAKLDSSISCRQSKTSTVSRQNLRRSRLRGVLSTDNPPPATTVGNYISFLSKGMMFFGSQVVADLESHHEEWNVRVTIYDCHLREAKIWGSMEAVNVPFADKSVVTYWEGEIIDNLHYTFITKKWGATPDVDIQHWKRFPAFNQIEFR